MRVILALGVSVAGVCACTMSCSRRFVEKGASHLQVELVVQQLSLLQHDDVTIVFDRGCNGRLYIRDDNEVRLSGEFWCAPQHSGLVVNQESFVARIKKAKGWEVGDIRCVRIRRRSSAPDSWSVHTRGSSSSTNCIVWAEGDGIFEAQCGPGPR